MTFLSKNVLKARSISRRAPLNFGHDLKSHDVADSESVEDCSLPVGYRSV